MWRKIVLGFSVSAFVGLGIGTWYQHDYCSNLKSEQSQEDGGNEIPKTQSQTTQEHLISGGPRFTFNISSPLIHQEYSAHFTQNPERKWSETFICEAKATDVFVVWFTFFLVGFTGLLYWVGLNAERSTKTIERAYVKMSHTEPGITWFGMEGGFTLEMKVENFGNTPADVTDVLLRPIILKDGELLPNIPNYERQRTINSFHTFLVKGDYFFYSNPELLSVGSSDERNKIISGEKILYVFGYVDYIDKFGTRHRSGYARRYIKGANVVNGRGNNLGFVSQRKYNYDRPRNRKEGNDWDKESHLE